VLDNHIRLVEIISCPYHFYTSVFKLRKKFKYFDRKNSPTKQILTQVNQISSLFTATGYRFSRSHEWTSLDGTKATIGVTNYAQVLTRMLTYAFYNSQDKLGDVVYVELPEVGQELNEDGKFLLCFVNAISMNLSKVTYTVKSLLQYLKVLHFC